MLVWKEIFCWQYLLSWLYKCCYFSCYLFFLLISFMKSYLQYWHNGNSDSCSFVVSSYTIQVPVCRQCIAHLSVQLILWFSGSIMYSYVQFVHVFPQMSFPGYICLPGFLHIQYVASQWYQHQPGMRSFFAHLDRQVTCVYILTYSSYQHSLCTY